MSVDLQTQEPKPETKVYPVADFKATGSAKGGRFEALVSVFDNVDDGGDRVIKGAFERTLKPPPEGKGFPPVVWTHLWGVVPIGASMRAEEASGFDTPNGKLDGLFIEGELLVDEHQTAKEVYAAMRQKGGDGLPPLRSFSFSWWPVKVLTEEDPEFVPVANDSRTAMVGHWRDLLDVELFEVGPCLVGMNPQTALLGVKGLLGGAELPNGGPLDPVARLLGVTAELKAGAVLSGANRSRVERAAAELQAVIEDADKNDEKDRGAQDEVETKTLIEDLHSHRPRHSVASLPA